LAITSAERHNSAAPASEILQAGELVALLCRMEWYLPTIQVSPNNRVSALMGRWIIKLIQLPEQYPTRAEGHQPAR
jgi:hypothetical protein